ncbi:hypothetical protein Ais01nite_15140 [Asanoa ishikariensis]|uniref:Maltokinase N-terminal cap domain-containing protein n=1 Tax=Asanoa ishikariensis TaxID=137265 RepID=A0A1H3UHY2_9ACTN|nr:hypothetical protein [Asanoa ishikariensis]GIF63479.1 hypothetical protein Ais01nite_15140 [Asanoa ishikariensis]SDZ62008.1 hypothetical protein SAMN05421684_7359 [Asanoa ishikariensis]
MALLHKATLTPTKLELLAGWLPGRRWHEAAAGELERVAAFRFDDPAGAVGIETMLVRFGVGSVHHVPLTYRDAPLPGCDAWLVGTTEHEVLGKRWVYDAAGDPVYLAALAGAIITGTGEAEEFVDVDGAGTLEQREPAMTARGTGVPDRAAPKVEEIRRIEEHGDHTVVHVGSLRIVILRRITDGDLPAAALTGRWDSQPEVILAYLSNG